MKKLFALTLVLVLALLCAACGSEPSAPAEDINPSEPAAASEIFPEPAEPAGEADYEITYAKTNAWTDSTDSVWTQTIVEFTNTGSKNLLMNPCSYDLEDASGKLVESQRPALCYPNVLAPGEKGYLYNEAILDGPVEGDLTVLPHEQIEEAWVDLIRLEVSEVELSSDDFGSILIRGKIENTTGEEWKLVDVVAILYDAEGSCVALADTIFTDPIAPGEKRDFELSTLFIPEDITIDTIANAVVYAYPPQMQFPRPPDFA